MRNYRAFGVSLLTLSLGLLILGSVLPQYKTPQTFTASGPNVTFTSERNYWIDFYLIEPIDEGQMITLALVSSKLGSTRVYLGPFDLQTSLFSGPAVVNEMLGQNETELVLVGPATKSGAYSLRITSWNSTYSVTVQSVWSPYYFSFRYVIVVAGALGLASLLLLYYGRIIEKRERVSAGQVHALGKSSFIAQSQTAELGHLQKAKHVILGIIEYASEPLSRLAAVGPCMIAVGLGGALLWGGLLFVVPDVEGSFVGIIAPPAILVCLFGGVVVFVLGILANIAREW